MSPRGNILEMAETRSKNRLRRQPLVVIGSSTGGPGTLRRILAKLPADLPGTIVIVQHMAENRIKGLVESLGHEARMALIVAEAGQSLEPHTAYLAPGGRRNLLIDSGQDGRPTFAIEDATEEQSYWPSIDVLFRSAAAVYKEHLIGILLSGMGTDGAKGMGAIREAHGVTIAESESTSVVFGMPKNAIDLGVVEMILPNQRIPSFLWGQVLSMYEGS